VLSLVAAQQHNTHVQSLTAPGVPQANIVEHRALDQIHHNTGMFTDFADKQNKERILGEKRTKHVPKLNRNRGPKTEVRTIPWVTCTVVPLLNNDWKNYTPEARTPAKQLQHAHFVKPSLCFCVKSMA